MEVKRIIPVEINKNVNFWIKKNIDETYHWEASFEQIKVTQQLQFKLIFWLCQTKKKHLNNTLYIPMKFIWQVYII